MRKVAETIISLLIILFLVTMIIILLAASPSKKVVDIEKTSVKDAVLLDAASRFPNAERVNIINIVNKGGSKVLVVRVTYNYSSTCPKRYHVYYTYPEGRFLPEHPVKASIECNACKKPCKLTYEEDAIIASVSLQGSDEVRQFVEEEKPEVKVEKNGEGWQVIWYNDNKAYVVTLESNSEGYYSISSIKRMEDIEELNN